ncbi:MAG: peptidoglycan -binding protein [Alphaproteobacteria bacterium]|nr:peptidoglycan -binding protein [Alphaproteobacteria bacterium]
MAGTRGRRGADYGEFWPGYVDALSTLLLVVTFLMSIFMLAQYFATQEASGKDNALKRLNRQIAELTSILSLERGKTKSAEDELAALQASLSSLQDENAKLSGFALTGDAANKSAQERISSLSAALEDQKGVASEALAKVDLLNQQLLALRRQIGALNEALEASEKKDQEAQNRIEDLGQRLNAALARQVQELKRYRSDFFGRLRKLLAGRKDIRVVGDRFVFQSEVLFPSGSDLMTAEGLAAMDQLASAIIELEGQIPNEIEWALQVDGHTDVQPINTPQFPSNWELSTARAMSVVKYLISRGVPPNRLVAAGYGEFAPLVRGNDADALLKNRRIELKLTNR